MTIINAQLDVAMDQLSMLRTNLTTGTEIPRRFHFNGVEITIMVIEQVSLN